MNNSDYKVSTQSDEVKRRAQEIEETILDDEEIKYALWIGKSIKWRKSQNPESDYKAKDR